MAFSDKLLQQITDRNIRHARPDLIELISYFLNKGEKLEQNDEAMRSNLRNFLLTYAYSFDSREQQATQFITGIIDKTHPQSSTKKIERSKALIRLKTKYSTFIATIFSLYRYYTGSTFTVPPFDPKDKESRRNNFHLITEELSETNIDLFLENMFNNTPPQIENISPQSLEQ
jgi:hypothetical protein